MEDFKSRGKTKEEKYKLLEFKRKVIKAQLFEDSELPEELNMEEFEQLPPEEIDEVITFSNNLIGKEYYKNVTKVS